MAPVKRKANGKKVKRDKSGRIVKGSAALNPAGAPKRGQSLKEIAKKIGDMTPKEAAEYCRAIAGEIRSIGGEVTLKEAVVLRIYTALLAEPDARLFTAIMDRDEGKVSQPVEVFDWRTEAERQGYDAEQLFTDMVNAARARLAGASGSGGVAGSDATSSAED